MQLNKPLQYRPLHRRCRQFSTTLAHIARIRPYQLREELLCVRPPRLLHSTQRSDRRDHVELAESSMQPARTAASLNPLMLDPLSGGWSTAALGLECGIVTILAAAFDEELDHYSDLTGSCARITLRVAKLLGRHMGSDHTVRICGGWPYHYFCEVEAIVVDTTIGQFFEDHEHAPRCFTGSREALVEWLRPFWKQGLLTAACYQKATDVESFVANQWGRCSSEDDPVLFIARGLEVESART